MTMNLKNFRFETGADGIAIAVWDMPGRSMNVITGEVGEELAKIIEEVASNASIKGCVIASGKDGFSGGADLGMLEGFGQEYAKLRKSKSEEEAAAYFFEQARGLSLLYRRLETCGKPFVAAIHGACLGGAFELALACHYRVAADDDKTRVGLPEIKVGLFPGAGGTQRIARLMQTGDALQMMLKGDQIRSSAAKGMGLIHAVAKREEVQELARKWIAEGGKAMQPWDDKNFRLPSGKVFSGAGTQIWPPANAIYRRETHDNYPAAKAMLQAVFEGLQLPMDTALKVESRYFAKILRSKEAAAMIRTLFISMGELNKGARRPASVPPSKIGTVGVIGAGFMGAGIAYVTALAGMNVVLVDQSLEAAEKGKAHSHELMTGQVMKGRAKTADRDALLSRIKPSADYAELAQCDLIVEAVFEDPKVKAEVIAKIEAVIRPDCVFGSNTSTLPISGLAKASKRPKDFIGIHFFSPVERMMLVEIIMGKETADRALAVALDYVRAIKKTPIVVNDARGFYANRCVGAYIREGHLMLMEGVPAPMIENLARMAGMPVGPLSLNDEVAIELAWKVVKATKAVDPSAVDPVQETLLQAMVETHGRLGRKNGKGFYDYPEKGKGQKKLWPGLKDLQKQHLDPDTLDKREIQQRLLVAQALEAARTVEEGVITDPREADVGSIIGFGFAPFTGGTLSYIDFMGTKRFVELAEGLAKKYGERFAPPKLLKEMAKTGETFYGKFAARPKEAA
jgi:3-hydroxyacyl-CoA dehydrogenase/enoyl-CoA hydratase/3-hydroxybutyryl-CoA epimerase